MAHGAVCRFELPHVAENNRRVTRVDSSLWPQRTVPKLPSGTNGCQTLKTATLNTSYFCQKRPLCQPPPSPTPPPNSHFVRKVKLRLAYRLAFVTYFNKFHISVVLYPEAWNILKWRHVQGERSDMKYSKRVPQTSFLSDHSPLSLIFYMGTIRRKSRKLHV